MKRLAIFLIALTAMFGLWSPRADAAVNDFTIKQYDIDYRLGRDADNRSVLTTKETITAVFPLFNQNHGIERYIPKKYDGHSTSLKITSVTKNDGVNWKYTTYDSGEYTVVRIGDANSYVHGAQSFVLTYEQRDVTKFFSNTNLDEFYWDTNGTAWRVPIDLLRVSLTIEDDIAGQRNDTQACYQGRYSAADRCELILDGNTYKTQATDLAPGDNVTLAVGFKPQTFAAYETPLSEKIFAVWITLQFMLFIPFIVLLIFLSIRYTRWSTRTGDVGTIVPEYIPPKDVSLQMAATVNRSLTTVFSAQLVDLAVRHYLKIYETKPKSFWSTARYDLEVVKPINDLTTEEKEFLTDIFGVFPVPGNKINTKSFQNNSSLSRRLLDNPKKLQNSMRNQYGMYMKNPERSAWFRKFALVLFVIALLLLSPLILIAALVSFSMSFTLWQLTDRGVELYRYLQGLKQYISVAEEERLRLMQSPEGAQKVAINSNDKAQLLKLYERVLPYAILFGQEKQWNKQLGAYYQETGNQPDWYGGSNMAAFNAAAFSSAMSNLTTSINSSGASSSSSGGSSGGGSSGGGGGGGGGGGW